MGWRLNAVMSEFSSASERPTPSSRGRPHPEQYLGCSNITSVVPQLTHSNPFHSTVSSWFMLLIFDYLTSQTCSSLGTRDIPLPRSYDGGDVPCGSESNTHATVLCVASLIPPLPASSALILTHSHLNMGLLIPTVFTVRFYLVFGVVFLYHVIHLLLSG